MQTLESRIASLERSNRLLARGAAALVLGMVGVALWSASPAQSETRTAGADVLRVRMLEIVDAQGTVRVRVGSNLPDAVIDGKTIGRGNESVAGIMLYDGTGQERGGYVTFEPSGNIGLTLDSRKGQVALFAAGPDEGATLRLWNGEEAIELRADSDGSRLTSVAGGTVTLQLPAIAKVGEPACNAYREARADGYPAEEIAEACSARFPVELCRQCLAE
ncbi:hypothetical protein J3454_15105 [Erythrobacter sp. NFXS35]|uniref:hypothetical protein n=1 Tax=Erythrobacter sp. NFXS35 TaxID=2818436 RepID=UPI0032DFDE59